MVIVAEEPRRSIIVGAGASFSFGLPLAGKLLQDASGRIIELDSRRAEIGRSGFRPHDRDISRDDELSLAVLKSIHPPLTLEVVAQSFREHLVQQNLDDFVRDHPSLTPLVSMLITTSLISSMYRSNDGIWELRPRFKKSGAPSENDWMRRFVGVVRPMASAKNKLSIISFNYDSLLERSMKMYWSGSEVEYAKFEDAIEFVYPHGKFSTLPDRILSVQDYLFQQATNLRVGNNQDVDARNRAKEIISDSTKIFSVGFSFSDNNLNLLGFDARKYERLYVQNFCG